MVLTLIYLITPSLTYSLIGEAVDRTPVWLMRQAGRYMADFRKYSEKYPFRQRSETPEIAIELSLQPWRTFGVDGSLFSYVLFTIHTHFIYIRCNNVFGYINTITSNGY